MLNQSHYWDLKTKRFVTFWLHMKFLSLFLDLQIYFSQLYSHLILIIQHGLLRCVTCDDSAVLCRRWPTMASLWTSARLASTCTPPSSSPAYQRPPACLSRLFARVADRSVCSPCSWAGCPASCLYCSPDTTVKRPWSRRIKLWFVPQMIYCWLHIFFVIYLVLSNSIILLTVPVFGTHITG